jgi:hypothetical protein
MDATKMTVVIVPAKAGFSLSAAALSMGVMVRMVGSPLSRG